MFLNLNRPGRLFIQDHNLSTGKVTHCKCVPGDRFYPFLKGATHKHTHVERATPTLVHVYFGYYAANSTRSLSTLRFSTGHYPNTYVYIYMYNRSYVRCISFSKFSIMAVTTLEIVFVVKVKRKRLPNRILSVWLHFCGLRYYCKLGVTSGKIIVIPNGFHTKGVKLLEINFYLNNFFLINILNNLIK